MENDPIFAQTIGMKYGICHLSVITLHKESSHSSELVSQLLFGEYYVVIETKKDWIKVQCTFDGYEGWMPGNQYVELKEKEFGNLENNSPGIALDIVSTAVSNERSIPIVAGSSLHYFDGMNFKLMKEKFVYNGQAIVNEQSKNIQLLEKLALRYLQVPYLWGGRSPFGIDCSGFTQVIYKFINTPLKRDAYQQAEQGTVINFVEEAQVGDLAFFQNEEGKIKHVGIVLKDRKIIHASGCVRIDTLDHFGIFNNDTKKYSHSLKIIKRVL